MADSSEYRIVEEGTRVHSVTFGDKNSWDDWHLVPSSRPLFNPPTLKTKYIDIPGGDGHIDLTDSLTGYPVFENRQGSMEFLVLNGWQDWSVIYSNVMNYLHGRRMRAILSDDSAFYYYGRFNVNSWKSEQARSVITIDYNVEPYKWEHTTSIEDWLWDTFNFETGMITKGEFSNIDVLSSSSWTKISYKAKSFSPATVCPIFKVSSSSGVMDIRFVDKGRNFDVTKRAKNGDNQFPDIVFLGNDIDLYFRGAGHVSIDFRRGRL